MFYYLNNYGYLKLHSINNFVYNFKFKFTTFWLLNFKNSMFCNLKNVKV